MVLGKIKHKNMLGLGSSLLASALAAAALIFFLSLFRQRMPLKAAALSASISLEERGRSAAAPLGAAPAGEMTLNKDRTLRESNFENGDVIFRRGVSLESRAIIALDGQFGYSHAGIIRKNGSRVEVIHASYAEEGQTQEIIISEPIERFLKPSSSSAAVAYRLNTQDKSLPLIALSEAERFMEAKISFDKDFDLTTEDKLYCTELIWRAFKKAGVDLTAGKFDRSPYLFGQSNKDYILPSSLLNSSQLQKVWASN